MAQEFLFSTDGGPGAFGPSRPDDMPPHNGTETSRAAAESVKDAVGAQEALILGLMRAAAAGGLTDDEIEEKAGLRHESASARRRGLVLRGFVVDSGKTRPTRRGRKAVCWIAAEFAGEASRGREDVP